MIIVVVFMRVGNYC